MAVSEAQLRANRTNALRSTGPKTPEGKAISRANSIKHGLAGSGIVLAADESAEVARRDEGLKAEIQPQSLLGQILVRQLAALSVKVERASASEIAHVASQVRHATENFDHDRLDDAEFHFLDLPTNPRVSQRALLRTPEGVDRLVEGWQSLRQRLAGPSQPNWTHEQTRLAANLLGQDEANLPDPTLFLLSRALSGYKTPAMETDPRFHEILSDNTPGALARWSRTQLIDWVDTQLHNLANHRATLNLRAIDDDRAQAPLRALFNTSREATLARRYEAEARRAFFKTLDMIQLVEQQTQTPQQLESTPAEPEPAPPAPKMASSRNRAQPHSTPPSRNARGQFNPATPAPNPPLNPSNPPETSPMTT